MFVFYSFYVKCPPKALTWQLDLYRNCEKIKQQKFQLYNRAYSFSGVTNKIHHCLRFRCGSRHLVPALVSHTSVIFGCDTKLMCDTNTNTCICDTNAGTKWRLPHGNPMMNFICNARKMNKPY